MDIPLQYNQCSTLPGCPSPQSPARMNQACVKIIEQPARCALRFRYECEGRSAGSIPGTSSSPDNKTYPTIQGDDCSVNQLLIDIFFFLYFSG